MLLHNGMKLYHSLLKPIKSLSAHKLGCNLSSVHNEVWQMKRLATMPSSEYLTTLKISTVDPNVEKVLSTSLKMKGYSCQLICLLCTWISMKKAEFPLTVYIWTWYSGQTEDHQGKCCFLNSLTSALSKVAKHNTSAKEQQHWSCQQQKGIAIMHQMQLRQFQQFVALPQVVSKPSLLEGVVNSKTEIREIICILCIYLPGKVTDLPIEGRLKHYSFAEKNDS